MTVLTAQMITESVLKRLVASGYKTLEDCARAGNSRLLQINSVSSTTLRKIRLECKRRNITWNKSESEKALFAELEQHLVENYGISQEEARVCSEVYFTEGWKL